MVSVILFAAVAATLFNAAALADSSEVMFSAKAKVEVANGYYEATVYYLYNRTNQYLRYDYTYPTTMIDLIDYVDGARYKVCTKCESGFYKLPAPILYTQSTDKVTTEVENGCTKHIPSNTEGVLAVWYSSNGTVCKAELPDGKTLVFSNLNSAFKDRKVFNLIGNKCPAPVCKRVMDIEVVVDNSGSVGKSNWNGPIKNFLYQLVGLFDLGPDATQIGLLTYSTGTREVFKLSYDAATMNRTIKNAAYKQGGTCTGCGINAGVEALKNINTHRAALDPEKILMVITDGENWDYAGTPCADYKPVCTEYSKTNCVRYSCSTGFKYKDSNVCIEYADDTTKCKRYRCDHCKNNKWGANCLSTACIKRDTSKCAKRDTSYCTLAYPDCSVSNGAIVQNKKIRCICSTYKCVENLCTKYNCTEYSCDECVGYSKVCAEYEKKCVKYAQIESCSGTKTCAEYECLKGTIKCNKTYKTKQAMITGAIIRTRTQWALYPATKRLPIVISIGVGRAFEKELLATASTIQGKTLMYLVSDFKSLSSIFSDLIEETCVSQADNLEACSDDCKSFCGCDGKCFCPKCYASTGQCYTNKCTTDGKTSKGCVVTHNTCPNTNKCITKTPDNETDGCCITKDVDCSYLTNRCFIGKCKTNFGCYAEPIEPVPENPCLVGDVCYNLTGWTYKSACPFINNCTNNTCTVIGQGFTCKPVPKCNSNDLCITDTCDEATGGTCGQIHMVCTTENKCNIPYCYNGNCYERANSTLKTECSKLTSSEDCLTGYCNSTTGECNVNNYTGSDACSYCKNFDIKTQCGESKCMTYSCYADENNEPKCNATPKCEPYNACDDVTCDETTGECKHNDRQCLPRPCQDSQCVLNDTKPDGYECIYTSRKTNTTCALHICNETTGDYYTVANCSKPEACYELDTCSDDDGEANCTYIPKTCKTSNKCERAFCDPEINDCRIVDISDELCPRLPCKTVKCDPELGCVYADITCDDEDPCSVDSCVLAENYNKSSDTDAYPDESFAESQENFAYVCVHTEKCPQTEFCTNASCYQGSCTYTRYTCADLDKSSLDGCHDFECDEEKKMCKVVLLPAAFLDVCGSCVKEYGNDPDLDEEVEAVKCVGNMKLPDFAAAISGAAVAGIVIAAIIIVAVIGVSSTIATKELIKRAKKNADTGTNSNPLYEGNDNEGINPAFTGGDA